MPNTPDRNYNVGQSMINDQHDGGPGVPYHNVVITLNAPLQTVTAAALTSGILVTHTLDALTTGGALVITSDSSNTGTRVLVQITNDNTAATGAVCLSLKNDSTAGAAMSITGTGVLGIDFSALGVADSIFKATFTTDATMKAPQTVAADGFFKVDVAGTAHYVPAYTVA